MKSQHSNPVFVLGFFRSGTSLLHSLLNQHPQVSLMYECDALDFPALLAKWRFKRNWLERQEFYCRALSRHRLTFAGSLRGLENVRTPEDLYRAAADGKRAALWGEKSPFYGPRLEQLAHAYPQASFILLWRDPLEIYRSVLHAGRDDHFFRRPGMVARLIHHQEQMIRQATEVIRSGARVHHITYSQLVDNTREACVGLCRFLNIEFDETMVDLAHADFSAVYAGSHHDQLRRGVIKRQRLSDTAIHPSMDRKLRRFGTRWNRLLGQRFRVQIKEPSGSEPGLLEQVGYRLAGTLLDWGHNAKRALFEILPLPWLRAHRLIKVCVFGPNLAQRTKPLADLAQLRNQWPTLLAAALILAGVALLDLFTGPEVSIAPFYMIPCALLTLGMNRRWGTLGAVAEAVIWSVLQHPDASPAKLDGIVVWNSIMRFVVLQTIVLLLSRVQSESSFANEISR